RKSHLLEDKQIPNVGTRWKMGMRTQLMIEDQSVETPSGFIVTPSGSTVKFEALETLAWGQRLENL
ncbi:hypothetical protein Tco_1061988, partial [Tanacetum coccineum]